MIKKLIIKTTKILGYEITKSSDSVDLIYSLLDQYPDLAFNSLSYGPVDIEARKKAHDFAREFLVDNKPKLNSDNNCIPRNVYMYWDQGWDKAPHIIKSCRRQAESMTEGFNIHFLDFKSASEMTDIPEAIRTTLNSNLTKYANIVRCDLLSRYGGIWIDATIFMTRPLNDLMDHIDNRYFSYTRKDQLLSSWMMVSPPGHIIPTLLRDAHISWWLKTNELPAYFWFHYLFEAFYNILPEFRNAWDDRFFIPSAKADMLIKYLDSEYNDDLMNLISNYTFVQKLSFKKQSLVNPKPNTFAHYLDQYSKK